MRKSTLADVFRCGLLAAITAALYRSVLGFWWTYDDAFHLRLASTIPVSSILGSRSFWQQLPNPVFTPLILFSVKSDLACCGLNAYFHYVHHLIVVALIPVAVYALCRLWVAPWRALAAALLVVLGPPMCEITAQMFHRNYVEGLVLALVAMLTATLAFRRQQWSWSIISAILYLAAMLEKEVYVPFPLIAAAIPESKIRVRAKYLVPHVTVAGIYAVWRTAMLGFRLSGYGLTPGSGEWSRSLVTLPKRMLLQMSGEDRVAGALLLTGLALILLAILMRRPRSRVVVVAGLVTALAPILPVSAQMQSRFVLVTWTLAAVACAFFPAKRRLAAAPLVCLIALALIANRAQWATTIRTMKRMSDEARFYVQMRSGILLDPIVPPAAFNELAWVKAQINAPSGGRALYDDGSICDRDTPEQLYRYADRLGRVTAISPSFVERTVCRNIREDLPLDLHFSYRDDVLYWNLGPYDEGRYRFVLADGAQAFDVPREAGFRLPGAAGMALRVRYESPAGWITYSPLFALDFARRPVVTWRR